MLPSGDYTLHIYDDDVLCLYIVHCDAGEFYSRSEERCVPCARDSYQPLAGQNFCVDCPGDTQTDVEGAAHSSLCKGTQPTSHVCCLLAR